MRLLYLTTIMVVACGVLNAQVKLSVSQKKLSNSEINLLNKHFKKYKTITIDKKEVLDSLKNYGKCRFQLTIDKENDWSVNLRLNDMRTLDFKASYISDSETFNYASYVPNTYKGETLDNKIARFTIDDDEFWGIITNHEKQVVIRQMKDYTKNSKDESLIIYERSDVILTNDNSDVVTDILYAPIENTSTSTFKAALCEYYLQIATEADFEFYQAMGNNLANTYSYIFSVLNLIEGVYEATFNLKFVVTFQNVWTTSNDPYTSTTSASALLNEFRKEWNVNRTGITRDIAHLFTGRDYSGWGIAWKGHIGSSYAYSSSELRAEMFETTAHEVGHNLNANDVNLLSPIPADCLCGAQTASVMCQGLKANNLWFCQTSINEISPFLTNNSAKLTGNFQDYLTLSGSKTGFNEYRASEKITSTQVIENGLTVYKTKEVVLNENFEVKTEAEFHVIADDNGCE
ncbi:MAG: M12 family metallo-peptidase [Paludibacteraceae bacterium]